MDEVSPSFEVMIVDVDTEEVAGVHHGHHLTTLVVMSNLDWQACVRIVLMGCVGFVSVAQHCTTTL